MQQLGLVFITCKGLQPHLVLSLLQEICNTVQLLVILYTTSASQPNIHNKQEYCIPKYQNITYIRLPGPSSLGVSLCPWDSCKTHDKLSKETSRFCYWWSPGHQMQSVKLLGVGRSPALTYQYKGESEKSTLHIVPYHRNKQRGLARIPSILGDTNTPLK